MCMVLCIETRQEIDPNGDQILNYITKNSGPKKKVTLVLGAVGSGKTTLALLLTGKELEAKVVRSLGLRIVDKDDKIGTGSMETPRTIVPQLMSDNEDSYYYDCMGFSDSRKINNDIEITLLFRKLFNSAEKFNFIFTIAYNNSMESDIKKIIENLSDIFNENFINQKYDNTIALVVTKAPNKKGVIAFVKRKLKEIEKEYEDQSFENEGNLTNKKKALFASKLVGQLINAKKIGIFRKPNMESKPFKVNNVRTKEIILNLDYVSKDVNDYNFSLKLQSKEKVNEKIDNFLDKIVGNFGTIIEGINDFIVQEEKRYSYSLDKSIESAKRINETLTQINSIEPLQFKQQLINMIYDWGIKISGGSLQKSLQYIEFIDTLSKFSKLDRNFTVPQNISDELANVKENIGYSLEWYAFLTSLRQSLDDIIVHKQKFLNEFNVNEHIIDVINRMEIRQNSKNKIQSAINRLRDEKSDKSLLYKFELLNATKYQSLGDPEFICNETHLMVRGYNIYMQSVEKDGCFGNAQHVHIFAINKFFVDAQIIVATRNMEMAIISPIWQYNDTYNGNDFQFFGNLANNPLDPEKEYSRFIGIGQSLPNDKEKLPGKLIIEGILINIQIPQKVSGQPFFYDKIFNLIENMTQLCGKKLEL